MKTTYPPNSVLRAAFFALAVFWLSIPALAQASFSITTLTANNANLIEHEHVTGDDRGGIALSSSSIFYTGDSTTGRFDLANLANETMVLGATRYDAMASNLRTKQIYSLGTQFGIIPNGGGMVYRLVELDPVTGAQTGNHINLSIPINMGQAAASAGIFSGWDRIVLLDGISMTVYNIDLPSGIVTNLGTAGLYSRYDDQQARLPCENWATWGVAEYSGGTVKLAFSAGWDSESGQGSIRRYEVGSGAISTIANFPSGVSDMCSFTVDPAANRWYFHYEGWSEEFGFGNDENIGYADATFMGTSAAQASLSGRVTYVNKGRAISGVAVTLTKPDGTKMTAVTNNFGNYSFSKLDAGESYVVSVSSRRHVFPFSTEVISLSADRDDVDFEAQ